MPDLILPQVKNIVFLMLENRSFDNLLGWLYKDAAPNHFYPRSSPQQYNGLEVGKFSNPDSGGKAVDVIPHTGRRLEQRAGERGPRDRPL